MTYRAFQVNAPNEAPRDSAKPDASSASELPHRTPFPPVVDRQLANARRSATPLTVVTVALDGVDSIRARYGTHIESRLLEAAWSRLRSHLRATDLSVRTGNAEFGAVLPEAGKVTAALVEARMLDALARPYGIETLAIAVAVRVGVAVYPDDGATAEALVDAAGAACAAERPWPR